MNREPQLPRWELDESDIFVIYDEVEEAANVGWWSILKWCFYMAIIACVASLVVILGLVWWWG